MKDTWPLVAPLGKAWRKTVAKAETRVFPAKWEIIKANGFFYRIGNRIGRAFCEEIKGPWGLER